MSLRSRLARLPTPANQAPKAPEPPPESHVRDVAPGSKNIIEDLRSRMEAILARTRAEPKREPPRVDVAELPFCVEDTPDGPLHVRTLHLNGAHRVGRMPACAARRAESELIALLAL